MLADTYYSFGLVASIVGLACGLFFFMYSVRYYLASIFILLKDQQALERDLSKLEEEKGLGFAVSLINQFQHYKNRHKKNYRAARIIGFKKKRVKNEELINEVSSHELGYAKKTISTIGQEKANALAEKIRHIYWEIAKTKNQIIVRPARLGIRKRLHALLMMIIKKADYDEIKRQVLAWVFAVKAKLFAHQSWTVDQNKFVPQISRPKELNYQASFLGFSPTPVGLSATGRRLLKKNKHYINRENIKLIDDLVYQPFVSIHLAFYNEENVARRIIEACLNQDYQQYEIIIVDDSNDRTPAIIQKYRKYKNVKIFRRDNREGYKGGALKEAIKQTDPRAEHIIVFDADFVPPPGTIKMFLQEFYRQNGNSLSLDDDKNLAAVQGYQWHVLNKDENFVTAGVRFGFAGGYMVERTAQQYFGSMKMIAGSVFMIRRDLLAKYTWQIEDGYTSIVEDWNLTIRMYIDGWKIGYTPDIKVPAECVNSLNKLARQQIRWAEGHTWNVKKYFWQVMTSPKMTLIEKLEFIQYGPFYLQAALFIIGTLGWVIGELIFHIKVPGWTATLGWSLVFTNLMALPVMCISGLVLERGEDRDYNFLPFLTYIYYIIPHLSYAAVKGLISPYEGGWVRTKKTGSVTDAIMESQMAGSNEELIAKNEAMLKEDLDATAKKLSAEHKLYAYKTEQTEELKDDNRLWLELKRVPRLGLTVILIMTIMLGSLSYLATSIDVEANPDLFYLNYYSGSNGSLEYTPGDSETEVTIDYSHPSFSWYSDVCPSGDEDGGIAAGNYSSSIYLSQKPVYDTLYSFTVGHVNSAGGDYQYITSTNSYIGPNSPTQLNLNLGTGPELICTQTNPRRLIYTITYLGEAAGSSITLNGYTVSHTYYYYDSSSDSTTFSYLVTGPDSGKAMSNIIFELCPSSTVVSYSPPGSVEIGTDPNYDIYGIKWDEELEIDGSQTYSFTMQGYYSLGTIANGNKSGKNRAIGYIWGPKCEETEIEYDNGLSTLVTPHIIVPEASLLLGLPALFGLWYSRRKKAKAKINN
ncbi:MAG: glycosyltransferase [Patescibacteria group bacterium]